MSLKVFHFTTVSWVVPWCGKTGFGPTFPFIINFGLSHVGGASAVHTAVNSLRASVKRLATAMVKFSFLKERKGRIVETQCFGPRG